MNYLPCSLGLAYRPPALRLSTLSLHFAVTFRPLSAMMQEEGVIGMCACGCVSVNVFMQVCVCNGYWSDGGGGMLGLCCADVIIRHWNSENSWEGWTVLEGFFICCSSPTPSQLLALRKNTTCSNTQQSITPNCRTHIVNNKYPRTSYNCNLMVLRFTSICDMLV